MSSMSCPLPPPDIPSHTVSASKPHLIGKSSAFLAISLVLKLISNRFSSTSCSSLDFFLIPLPGFLLVNFFNIFLASELSSTPSLLACFNNAPSLLANLGLLIADVTLPIIGASCFNSVLLGMLPCATLVAPAANCLP